MTVSRNVKIPTEFLVAPISMRLLAQQPQHHRDNDTDKDHRGNGNKDFKIWFVDDDVARQPTQGQLDQPGPQKTDQYDDNADDDQSFLHQLKNIPMHALLETLFRNHLKL